MCRPAIRSVDSLCPWSTDKFRMDGGDNQRIVSLSSELHSSESHSAAFLVNDTLVLDFGEYTHVFYVEWYSP